MAHIKKIAVHIVNATLSSSRKKSKGTSSIKKCILDLMSVRSKMFPWSPKALMQLITSFSIVEVLLDNYLMNLDNYITYDILKDMPVIDLDNNQPYIMFQHLETLHKEAIKAKVLVTHMQVRLLIVDQLVAMHYDVQPGEKHVNILDE
ncbi:hypothetical protein DFH29DRAFT_881737 [Suillus ampliporus]|nr:hypothetical protein DFH29DRAFT_881737 [Suillus ampliporus]